MLDTAHNLNAGCHNVTHGQVHTHGIRANGNLGAGGGESELKGNAACLPYSAFHSSSQLPQMGVACGIFAEGVGNPDVGAVQVLGVIPASLVH